MTQQMPSLGAGGDGNHQTTAHTRDLLVLAEEDRNMLVCIMFLELLFPRIE